MKVAIYARKSNDDNDAKSADDKSVARQVRNARAYAEGKGWTVADEHVYVDDGVSGAEYAQRPGLVSMLAHLDEFDVLVTREVSRLGRDMIYTAS